MRDVDQQTDDGIGDPPAVVTGLAYLIVFAIVIGALTIFAGLAVHGIVIGFNWGWNLLT